jgi:hypothetical protein
VAWAANRPEAFGFALTFWFFFVKKKEQKNLRAAQKRSIRAIEKEERDKSPISPPTDPPNP